MRSGRAIGFAGLFPGSDFRCMQIRVRIANPGGRCLPAVFQRHQKRAAAHRHTCGSRNTIGQKRRNGRAMCAKHYAPALVCLEQSRRCACKSQAPGNLILGLAGNPTDLSELVREALCRFESRLSFFRELSQRAPVFPQLSNHALGSGQSGAGCRDQPVNFRCLFFHLPPWVW